MDAKTFDRSKLPSRRIAADLKPGVHHISGVLQIKRALRDGCYLPEDCVKQNLENVKIDENQKVARPVSKPISPVGVAVGLQCTLDQMGPARTGAVTHAGGGAEVACYADI